MDYLASLVALVSIYAILSMSLSLLIGHLGIFSMAHAALFGIGAYGYAISTTTAQLAPLLGIAIAVLAAGIGGLLIAIPALRVQGVYFLVASFAIQLIANTVFDGWESLTGGVRGIPGVPRSGDGIVQLLTPGAFGLYAAGAAVISGFLMYLFINTPYSVTLHMIRDDEHLARSFGKPIARSKIVVSLLSGAFAGFAGAIYAQYLMYVSPANFQLTTSISIITMVVLGGSRSIPGAAIGAIVITAFPFALQELDIPSDVAGPVQQVLFGFFLVAIMFLRPEGMFKGNDLRIYKEVMK